MAYWHLLHNQKFKEVRPILTQPAGYSDLVDQTLIENGINPAELKDGVNKQHVKSKLNNAGSSGGNVWVLDGGVKKPASPTQAKAIRGMAGNPVDRKMLEAGFSPEQISFWKSDN